MKIIRLIKTLLSTATVCLFLLILTAHSQADEAGPIGAAPASVELTMNSLLHPFAASGDHSRIWFDIQKPLYDEIEKRSKGSIKIKPYFDETFTPISGIYPSVLEGKADIGFSVLFSTTSEQYPISNLFRLTRVEQHTSRASYTMWKMLNEWPEARQEWSEVKVLYNYIFYNGGLATTSVPVRTLDDLKGLRIMDLKSPWLRKQLQALGAIPVPAYSLEAIRTLLENGEADGFIFDSPDFVVGYDFIKYVKYYTDLNLGPAITYTVMNRDSWNALRPEHQAIFDDVFGERGHRHCDLKITEKDNKASEISAQEYGVNWIYLSAEEKAKAAELLQPVRQEYAEFLNKKGYNGAELLERFEDLYNEYAD